MQDSKAVSGSMTSAYSNKNEIHTHEEREKDKTTCSRLWRGCCGRCGCCVVTCTRDRHIYIKVHLNLYSCINLWMDSYIYTYACVFTYVYRFLHIYIYIYTWIHVHTRVCSHIHICLCTHVCTCIQVCIYRM